jgi:alkylation response protein AidB-like acyl-CoA dehydrogenase
VAVVCHEYGGLARPLVHPLDEPHDAGAEAMTMSFASIPRPIDEYREALRSWLAEHRDELQRRAGRSHEERFANGLALSRSMWDLGWKRVGWPESLGGLGGGPRHRATYYDEICRAELELPDTDLSIEVIGPALLKFAPALAEEYLPHLLGGREAWAQAFSEPDAGSDLAALRTRGVIEGEEVVVDGQKVWTSHGHLAARLLTLVRTGTTESRHRGLAALLIDTDSPGLSRNPLTFASGIQEMCETFFDEVHVPIRRMIGAPDDGWNVAMQMLQYERSMYAAQRQGWLGLRLRNLTASLGGAVSEITRTAIGNAWLQLQTVRARAIESVRRLDAGESIGPEASADKILLARAEQSVFEIARQVRGAEFAFDDGTAAWRAGWWYSRAASIFGGAGEIQRSIIADRVLRLPREH